MNRRKFAQICMAVTGVAAVVPTRVFAGCEKDSRTGSIYYTKDAPGRWSGKIAGHLPGIEINKANGKVDVKVVTAHGMNGFDHYIVKHVLLDQDYQFIDEYMFNPLQESKPISTYTLDGYTGTLYALSMCNKHDLWLNEITV